MSYLDYTRETLLAPTEVTVCLTAEECKLLQPMVKKAYKQAAAKFEKYQDIHESGEATERQVTLMIEYYDKKEALGSLLKSIKELLK